MEQGKQGIWFLLFPDRENTGNFAVTQGIFLKHRENIFDCIYHCKKHVFLHIFSIFFSLTSLGILSTFRWLFLILFLLVYQYIYFPIFFPYHISYKVSTKLFFWAVLKTNVISNVYIQEFFKCNISNISTKTRGDVLLSIQFDTTRWFCLWNSDQNCTTKLYHVL